jgi:hypothetical protein
MFYERKIIHYLTKQPILPGGFWLYPSSCKRASAAAFLASFLLGPLPLAVQMPTVTWQRYELRCQLG